MIDGREDKRKGREKGRWRKTEVRERKAEVRGERRRRRKTGEKKKREKACAKKQLVALGPANSSCHSNVLPATQFGGSVVLHSRFTRTNAPIVM